MLFWRVPDEFYEYLNRDGKRLGLSGGYHKRGKVLKHLQEYAKIRRDYIETVAKELYNQNRLIETTISPKQNQLLRAAPVSSHYANIQFIEDKYSKLPIHYYTAVKQGIIDPEVKKAIFSRNVKSLRNIQHIPRDVYEIFRSAGLKGYSEKTTTPTRNKHKMADMVANYNTNKETGEENYINNNYSKHVKAEESYKEGKGNNAALVSSSDFSSSVNSSDNGNSTDSLNASQDGSVVGFSNTENINNDNSKTDEFDKKWTSDDAASARNNQPITKDSSDDDIPESKTNYKPDNDTADSYKKLDINNEGISKNIDIDFYGDVTTSNIKSTVNLFDASTAGYDIFSKQTTDYVTDNYKNVADETTIEKTNAFDDFNDTVLTYGYEGRLNDFGTSIATTLSPDTYNNSDVSVTDPMNNVGDTTTTTTTVNDGETNYDFDKLVTTTSSYLNSDSVDSYTPDDMATDSTDVSGYILSDTDFNDAFIWSSTTKPYLDSNSVNGKYDGVVETDKEFGNNSTDTDSKDVSTTTTTYSDTTNTDNTTADNTAIDTTNENNNSSDIIATDTFDNTTNTNSFNATETASSVTTSPNDSSFDSVVIDVTNANGNVSDSSGTEYINSNSNSSDTADTKTESSISDSSADFASDNTAVNMDNALINSTKTTDTNGSETNFVVSDSTMNTLETYSISNSTIDVSAGDAGKDLADEYENTSTSTVTDSSSDSNASDASIATTTVSTITNNAEFSSDDTAININDTFSDSANTEISGSDSSVINSDSSVDLSTTYSINNTADASAPDDIATQFSNSTDTEANNDTDKNINDAGTITTTQNTNSEDSLTPDKWIDRENALSNLTGIAATNDFYSNYDVNETLPATETTVLVSNSSDSSTSDNMAIDTANEDKNSSYTVAVNGSDNNFNESDTTVLLPVKNSMYNSTDNFASDNEALDEVNKYNNSSDGVVVNSSDSNFDESGTLVPTATTYSINNNADNFASDAVAIDEANVNNNSSDSTSVSSDSNFEQPDTTILLPTIYSLTNSTDNLDSNNRTADIGNGHDNSSDVNNINGFEDNPNDSNTLNATETSIGDVSDDSSDNLAIETNNSTETPTDLTYSYFDITSNDTVTESMNSNTDDSTDTSTTAVNESVNSATEESVSTATESQIATDISTTTAPEIVSSDNKDDNSNSETVTTSDPATSSVAETNDIKDAGSSGTINDSNSIIPKNDHESSTDKGLEADNRAGPNGAEGDKNNAGKSVIVQSQSKIEKKEIEKKEIEGIESKSDEDVIITSKSTSVETPVLTNVDSIRIDSGSYSVEKF